MAETRVALTIDDLPWHAPVPRGELRRNLALLSGSLADAGVPATGFVNGGRAHLAETRVWLEAGLPLGNHTYSHVALSDTPADSFVADILHNERTVLDVLGHQLQGGWFRYPHLDHGTDDRKKYTVAEALRMHGYTLAPVSINTCDYAFACHEGFRQPSARLLDLYCNHVLDCVRHFTRLGRRLHDRDVPHVLLLHANALNAQHISELLVRLLDLGCEFIPLTEALADPVYRPFDLVPPESGEGSRGDIFGDVATSVGLLTDSDPSRVEWFHEHWAHLIHAPA